MEYIEISRANDLKNKKERILYRFFEILPGFLSSFTLVFTILGSFFIPQAVAIFIILFSFYWLLRVFYFSIHQVSSFLKMRKNIKINWLELAKKFEDFEKIYHLVILPFYKEEKQILRESLEAILNSDYPKEKIIIVLAAEERGGEKTKKISQELFEEFSKYFFKFYLIFHPDNLEGELKAKGANVNFALNKIKPEIENLRIEKENIIVSIFDADTKVFSQYFACLTFNYLNLKKPTNLAFQPIPVYNNNIWQAPSFSRVVATSNTFWQMIQQERPEQLVTYSSHSLSWSALEKVGYPKNVVSDDSRIFWKLYFFYDGKFKVLPLYYPVSMDAVLGKNLWQTIINQYRQQRRWAWGAENIPFVFFGFLKNKKIPLFEKVRHSFIILEGFWSWATTSLLIFLLGWFPVIFGGEKFQQTLLSYRLPVLTRNLMSFSMFGLVICATLSFLLLPQSPKNSFKKKLSILLQWLLLPLTLIFFGCFPALDAQIRLMLGKYLGFWTTEKYRK